MLQKLSIWYHRTFRGSSGHLLLHGPLGLALAPNGDLISTQGDAVNPDPAHPSEVVKFTDRGKFVAEFSVDPSAGSAFGLAIGQFGNGVVFATVDDTTAVLDIWLACTKAGDGRSPMRSQARTLAETHSAWSVRPCLTPIRILSIRTRNQLNHLLTYSSNLIRRSASLKHPLQ